MGSNWLIIEDCPTLAEETPRRGKRCITVCEAKRNLRLQTVVSDGSPAGATSLLRLSENNAAPAGLGFRDSDTVRKFRFASLTVKHNLAPSGLAAATDKDLANYLYAVPQRRRRERCITVCEAKRNLRTAIKPLPQPIPTREGSSPTMVEEKPRRGKMCITVCEAKRNLRTRMMLLETKPRRGDIINAKRAKL
jgi:hypothetical protein